MSGHAGVGRSSVAGRSRPRCRRDRMLALGAARQLDEPPTGQFDVDEESGTDGDDDGRPQQTVDGVGLRVDLVSDGVVQRLSVVEAVERPTFREPSHKPRHFVAVLWLSLVTRSQRTLHKHTALQIHRRILVCQSPISVEFWYRNFPVLQFPLPRLYRRHFYRAKHVSA